MNIAEVSIMPHLGIVFLLLRLYPEYGSREPTPHIISFVYLHQFYPRYLKVFWKKLELENQKLSKQTEIKRRQERRMQLSYEYHLLVVLFLLWFLSALNCCHWAVTLVFLLYLLWVLADSEILRLLNYLTERSWCKYLGEYASEKIFQPIVNWYLEKHKPPTLKKARVQLLCLGSNPPSFYEFHFFRNSDSNGGWVMELGINFSADNNMRSIIATKPRDRSGSGMGVKLKMTNLKIDGKILIVVNFLNRHPFVRRLQVCFVEPPCLKMTVHPLPTCGFDPFKHPDIFRNLVKLLDHLCSDATKKKLVWPSTLTLNMERYAATCTENTESCFFLDVKEPVACVTVGGINASGLNPPWFAVDWYVKVRVGNRILRSRTQRTQSPFWNEEYKIPVPTSLDKIMVKVCYEGILGGMIYGWSSLDINAATDGGSHSRQLPLRNNMRQFLPLSVAEDLHLSVAVLESNEDSHLPNEASSSTDEGDIGYAKVEVIEALVLQVPGSIDPYVMGWMGWMGLYRFRTKTQHRTDAPKWHEEHTVPILTSRGQNILHMEVRNQHRSLGSCSVNMNSVMDGMRHDIWLHLEDVSSHLEDVSSGRLHIAITVPVFPAR